MNEETTFSSVKSRLDEIVEAVSDEGISLDEALDLYEEAVKLGMQASSLLEEGIAEQDTSATEGEAQAEEGPDAVAGESGSVFSEGLEAEGDPVAIQGEEGETEMQGTQAAHDFEAEGQAAAGQHD